MILAVLRGGGAGAFCFAAASLPLRGWNFAGLRVDDDRILQEIHTVTVSQPLPAAAAAAAVGAGAVAAGRSTECTAECRNASAAAAVAVAAAGGPRPRELNDEAGGRLQEA